MFRLYKWWENEKEVKILHHRLEHNILYNRDREEAAQKKIEKLTKENQRMREIIVCVSDKQIKEAM